MNALKETETDQMVKKKLTTDLSPIDSESQIICRFKFKLNSIEKSLDMIWNIAPFLELQLTLVTLFFKVHFHSLDFESKAWKEQV